MSRREATILYRSCFLPALTYSFPAIGLPSVFFERIHCLSTSTILNKMGFHWNLPRSVVFAPRQLGGIGLCNLEYEQCVQQIIILIRHLRARTPLGTAMETLIHTFQLWAGLRNHVLTDTQQCTWIPNQWLMHLRHAMQTYGLQISYSAWTVPPLRENDRYIMDDLADQDLPRAQLEKINACRMFLQVTTLSEITDHTGTEILPHVLTNQMHPDPRGLSSISFSTLQWLHIHPPSMACWRLWSLAICSVYAGSTKNTHITMPLGAWLPIHATTHFWNWHLLDVNHLMYQASANAKTCIALSTLHRRTLMKFSPTIPSTLEFSGPPITPLDPTTGYTRLSVAPIDFPVPANAMFFFVPQHFSSCHGIAHVSSHSVGDCIVC